MGYSTWGHKEMDMTELFHFLSFLLGFKTCLFFFFFFFFLDKKCGLLCLPLD